MNARKRFQILIVSVLLWMSCTANAGIIIEVIPSVGPNKNASGTGWNLYAERATASLIANSGNFGDKADVEAYEVLGGPVTAEDMISSDASPLFHSWFGEVNPSAPFQNEHGNRLHFGFRILATDGSKLNLRGITYSIKSDDTPATFSVAGSFASLQFTDTRVGVEYGTDGVLGGSDDTLITSGDGPDEGVDAIFYVGISVGAQASGTGTPEERVSRALSTLDGKAPFGIVGKYTLDGVSGQSLVSVEPIAVPEPSSVLAVSLLAFCASRRRKH